MPKHLPKVHWRGLFEVVGACQDAKQSCDAFWGGFIWRVFLISGSVLKQSENR